MKTCKTGCGKMQAGGSVKKVKKMQKGGSAGIVGMPQYGNNPRTYSGRMLKEGGAFAPNRAVQSSCKGGMVRDENGRCVMARKMAKGGFPDLNKDGKITKADILKGRGVIKKLGGATNDKYQYGGSKGSTKKPMLMNPAKIKVTPGKKKLTYNEVLKIKKK